MIEKILLKLYNIEIKEKFISMFHFFNQKKGWSRHPINNFPQKETSSKTAYRFSFLLKKIIFFLLLLFFIIAFSYAIFFSPFLETNFIIKNYSSTPDSLKLTTEINNTLKKELNKKYYGIIKHNNYFLINTSFLLKLLKQNYPQIKELKITKKFPHTLVIKFKLREKKLIWCLNDDCYWTDENGIAFQYINKINQINTTKSLIIIQPHNKTTISLPKDTHLKKQVYFLINFFHTIKRKKELQCLSKKINSMSFLKEKIKLNCSNKYKIYLNYSSNPIRTAKKLILFLEKLPSEEKKNLEYIDLETTDKIFYKLKNNNIKKDENETKKDSKKKEMKKRKVNKN